MQYIITQHNNIFLFYISKWYQNIKFLGIKINFHVISFNLVMLIIGGGDYEGDGDANSEDPNKYIKQRYLRFLLQKLHEICHHMILSLFL